MSTALATMDEMNKMAARLEGKVERLPWSGCWIWMGSLTGNEYGKLRVGHSKDFTTHKMSWVVHYGPVPDGKCVLHTCDIRSCINPNHLWLGTKAENSQDMVSKGRHKCPARDRTHCPKGHEYSGNNSQGRRICRVCQNAATLAYYHRNSK